jgi:hypothetical protein
VPKGVYLSMVADSGNKTVLTMLRYEQRFNVAVYARAIGSFWSVPYSR